MSQFDDGVTLLRDGNIPEAKQIFQNLINVNMDDFLKKLSESMAIDKIDPGKVGFKNWNDLAWAFIKNPQIAEKIWSIMIHYENVLESAIQKAKDDTEKRRLNDIKIRAGCSLGRDHCNLGIAKLALGKLNEAEKEYEAAYKEDLKGAEAVQKPAWWNLTAAVLLKAQIHFSRREYLPSFLIGWIAVEMGLRRLWLRLLAEHNYTLEEQEEMSKWEVWHIIETLYLRGELSDDKRKKLQTLREKRNALIHARTLLPDQGETKEIIRIAEYFLRKEGPKGARFVVIGRIPIQA